MPKILIYIVAFFIVICACIFTYKIVYKDTNTSNYKLCCHNLKSKKVKTKKIGKSKGKLFQKGKKEEKLYTYLKKNKDTLKQKMLFFVFLKGRDFKTGQIIRKTHAPNKTSFVIHDKRDIDSMVKKKNPAKHYDVIYMHNHQSDNNSLIEKRLK